PARPAGAAGGAVVAESKMADGVRDDVHTAACPVRRRDCMSRKISIRDPGAWLVVLTVVVAMGCAPAATAPRQTAAAPAASPPPAPAPAGPSPAPAAPGPPPAAAPAGAPPPGQPDPGPRTQRSVEYRATTTGIFALAQLRLDQALADPNWSAIIPKEQSTPYQSLPPAVIVDVDETVLDNSDYQAWNTIKDTSFDPKTWTMFVN